MKTKAISLFLTLAVLFAGCQGYDAPFNPPPTLTVADAADITRADATLKGFMDNNGGSGLPELYFEWWTGDEEVSASPLLPVTGDSVTYTLHNLQPGTVYFFRLKARGERATIESDALEFQTLPNNRPAISPLTPLVQGPSSLMARFTIEDDGGEPVTEAGCHVRNTAGGGAVRHVAEMAGNEVSITLRGLDREATLEITPYACNTVGETVGEPLMVTTQDAVSIPEAGMLAEIMGPDRLDFTKLSFSGFMNGDDIRTLREMAGVDFEGGATGGRLADMDLTEVKLTAGGGSYIPSRQTEEDVVGYGMFQDLTSLQAIALPGTATVIEEQAFMNCTGLKSITIPAAVSRLTPSDGCTALEAIDVVPASRHFRSIDGVLLNADATAILWFPLGKRGDYTLPATITTIGDYAFRNCHITRLTMPDHITQIGQAIFTGSSVERVVMSDQLAIVPTATFQSCASLTEVHLGSATELLGSYVFDGCPLTDLYLSATVPPVCRDDTFTSNGGYDLLRLCRLHVPQGCVARYRNHPTWGRFTTITQD